MAGAGTIVPAGGVLVTYGPYMRGGAHTSQSNEAFDVEPARKESALGRARHRHGGGSRGQ